MRAVLILASLPTGYLVEPRSRIVNCGKDIRTAEVKYFGIAYSAGKPELKAKKLLNRKVFGVAQQLELVAPDERASLARAYLEQRHRSEPNFAGAFIC